MDPQSEHGHEILTCQVPGRLEVRDELIETILGGVAAHGFQPDPHFHRLCLDEALCNAIIHGNRSDPAKTVTVRVFCLEDTWGVEIADEGRGFDWQAWLQRVEAELMESRDSGRGIALLLKCCSEVVFLDGGRKVRLLWEDGDRAASDRAPVQHQASVTRSDNSSHP
jgi:hypothetical protein